jgi:hypothetical protein
MTGAVGTSPAVTSLIKTSDIDKCAETLVTTRRTKTVTS